MARLTLIPTPVGNLEDITLRARRILSEVALVLAEDTRTTGKLLQLLGLDAPLQSYHMHNEHRALEGLLGRIEALGHVALVSDAGTPGISDPGFLLVRACIERGIEVECLPGPTAFVPALVASGLPCDRFVFEGFLPVKKGRQTRLSALREEERTIVLYESPHRLGRTLGELEEAWGDRSAVVVRELSKLHEEYARGTLSALRERFESGARGEIVLLVGGYTPAKEKKRRYGDASSRAEASGEGA